MEIEKGRQLSDPVFDVWVDEERQIIRQRMHQEPTLEDFRRLVEETDKRICLEKRKFAGLRLPMDSLVIPGLLPHYGELLPQAAAFRV